MMMSKSLILGCEINDIEKKHEKCALAKNHHLAILKCALEGHKNDNR